MSGCHSWLYCLIIVYGFNENRLNGLLSVGFKGVNSRILVQEVNQIGISVSSGSACSSNKETVSHVIEAIDSDAKSMGVIRFGLGRFTDEEDVPYVLKYFADALTISKTWYE